MSPSKSMLGSPSKRHVLIVIVKFDEKTRAKMRELGLKWNAIRGEWQGYVDIRSLNEIVEQKCIQPLN